jgi:formamidopyrimidine-DNA glycosylase
VPELPDVEAFRRTFARYATGRTVASVWADPTILRDATPAELSRALRGHRFDEPARLGKWLIAPTDGPTLLLHFGMTGDLIWSGHEPARHRHDRLALTFAGGGELRYRNMRKLGGVWLAHGPVQEAAVVGRLGPDALAVDRPSFLARLARRRGGLKAALMDQAFLAGVGNLIADEVLWQARLHPKRAVQDLSEDDRRRLFDVLRSVLLEAVERPAVIPEERSWLNHVRGLPDARCPRCGTPLVRSTVAGRTTYHCPSCQPAAERG